MGSKLTTNDHVSAPSVFKYAPVNQASNARFARDKSGFLGIAGTRMNTD
jgi:hypothetical protein